MSEVSAPVHRRRAALGRADGRIRIVAIQVLTTIAFVGLFELISRANTSALPEHLFPPPSAIFAEAYHTVLHGSFWRAFLGTLEGWGLGLALGAAVAIPCGILLGANKWTWNAARLLVDVLRPLPAIALLPLLVLVIGENLRLKVFIVAFSAFWPMLIQAVYGVQDVESAVSDMARAYRLRFRDRALRISLPTMEPYLATGLRISAIIALTVAIGAELVVGGQEGLGSSISLAQSAGQFKLMYVYILAAAVFSLVINVVFRRFERRILFWHPSVRGEAPL